MSIYEQIYAGLQTKFTGADDATLQRIASKKSEGVTDEGQVTSILEGVGFQDVMNSYGDYRANEASKTASKNALADYEKKHGLKDGKPIVPPTPPTQEPPTPKKDEKSLAEQIAEAIKVANQPLIDRLDRMDADKAREARDVLIEKTAKGFDIPKFAYKGKAIPEDADLNQWFTDLKQEMVNEGFKFVAPPDKAKEVPENESQELANLINEGTKKILEKNKH